MSFRAPETISISVLALVLVFAGLTAFARDGEFRRASDESTEVLFGYFTCGVDFESDSVSSWFSYDATGDIDDGTQYWNSDADVAKPDSCSTLASTTSNTLSRGGCAVGSRSAFDYDTGTVEEFQFACHGRRSQVISVLAQLIEGMITTLR